MNRTQLACYAMLASALVLTAMVLLQASRLLDDRAHAEMVVHKDAVTMITGRFEGDSEILYILDSRSGRLFGYMLDPNTQVIQPLGIMDVGREFGAAAGRDNNGRNAPARRRAGDR